MIKRAMTAEMRYQSTISFYEEESSRVTATYEAVDFRKVIDRVLAQAPDGGKLLDVGCGSGRDGAYLLSRGFEVTGTDASKAMIAEAVGRHPELAGRLLDHRLPEPLPFADGRFDVVLAMAVLMHLTEEDSGRTLKEMGRVTRTGGIVAYSVNTRRPGLDAQGLDSNGRHFICLEPERWATLGSGAGLSTVDSWSSEDLNDRPGIRWVTFVCRRE
jgi:SAM-dependent methyltransferase